MNLTLEQLYEIRAEIQLASFVNAFSAMVIDQDLRDIDAEIEVTKIVNLCLTGE